MSLVVYTVDQLQNQTKLQNLIWHCTKSDSKSDSQCISSKLLIRFKTNSCCYLLARMFMYLIECRNGKFGQNCSSLCGHCLKKDLCHFINGTCLNGCVENYNGSNCTQGNINFIFITLKNANVQSYVDSMFI